MPGDERTSQCGFDFAPASPERARTAHYPLSRANDPETSKSAAEVVAPSLTELQALVLGTYDARGPMSARKAERLLEFEGWEPNTIRKRISELSRAGHLVSVGIDGRERASITIWATPAWVVKNPTKEITRTPVGQTRKRI